MIATEIIQQGHEVKGQEGHGSTFFEYKQTDDDPTKSEIFYLANEYVIESILIHDKNDIYTFDSNGSHLKVTKKFIINFKKIFKMLLGQQKHLAQINQKLNHVKSRMKLGKLLLISRKQLMTKHQ